MTIKQLGGVFGRNPTFNNVDIENSLDITVQVDGNMVYFYKGNTLVGNIGTQGNKLTIGSSNGGLKFDSADSIVPHNMLTNSEYSGVVNLGTTGTRFKNLYLSDNVVLANGKGIDFSATAGAGTSELFDDYEEGVWTPVVAGSTTAGTYELQQAYGKYTKVGDLVTIEALIQLASSLTGGGAGSLNITGVPFSKPANSYSAAAAYVALTTISETPIVTWSSFNASSVLLLQQNASGGYGTSVAITDITTGSYISFSLTYKVV